VKDAKPVRSTEVMKNSQISEQKIVVLLNPPGDKPVQTAEIWSGTKSPELAKRQKHLHGVKG
jgi:hypothetical protein